MREVLEGHGEHLAHQEHPLGSRCWTKKRGFWLAGMSTGAIGIIAGDTGLFLH